MIAIAVDGPSGVGKSSVSSAVAKNLGLVHLNTGELYRAVALYIRNNGISEELIEENLKNINIDVNFENNCQKTILNGKYVTCFLKDEEIAKLTSNISKIKRVRDFLLSIQRNIAKKNNIIMDGRDIGTVVLPGADVKIFLTAGCEVRAKRRFLELQEKGNFFVTYEEILGLLKQRDESDTKRKVAPLKKAEDAILIDTSNLNLKETIEKITNIITTVLKKNSCH